MRLSLVLALAVMAAACGADDDDTGGSPCEVFPPSQEAVSPSSIPAAPLGQPYEVVFELVEEGQAVHFSLIGTLPRGMSWEDSERLTGTPEEEGTFPFVLETVDLPGVPGCATMPGEYSYELIVTAP